MKIQNTLNTIAASALSLCTSAVFAHDGHGLGGSHWHATDGAGFVTVGALVAVAIWLSRSGK